MRNSSFKWHNSPLAVEKFLLLEKKVVIKNAIASKSLISKRAKGELKIGKKLIDFFLDDTD